MKKLIASLIILLTSLIATPAMAADTDNFYFSDFTADYYLLKDDEGTSRLKVVESVTAEFPEFEQNKGICRQIPYTNRNDKNITLPSLTKNDIKITRNGKTEPIWSIEKENKYYNVCTGTDEYVLGTQVYVFEYEFTNVVTEFGEYQELYWDTNGNGAIQKFDSVTARLHFENKNVWTGKKWCYVGGYGRNGRDRCIITEISDGVEFKALSLNSFENLTFDVELELGSFIIPDPVLNYTYVWIIVALGVICVIFILIFFRKFLATREKARYYKGLFVNPEYQPHKGYDLTEMAEIYLGKKKDMKVAMLLSLVVKRKIDFMKTEDKEWIIVIKNLNGVRTEYLKLLTIINNGNEPNVGDEIKMKRYSATSRLISLNNSMERAILNDLKRDGLVENKYIIGGSKKRGFLSFFVTTITFSVMAMAIGVFILGLLDGILNFSDVYGCIMVFEKDFGTTACWMVTATVAISIIIVDASRRYEGHKKEGLKMSKYMEGLKLYIEMAEADRIKMLQSVEGVDTSAEGIVKLYEKLLPYAAVFGLEESWMKEMKEYCELEEIETPDYFMAGIAASELSHSIRSAASYATTSSRMSSSGGGSSSGFSGGGGGGFSGGGGGGGGFSGR
ncbi:DUF2207 domain-containing protein [Candidatus Saccharibacteria bacterium]|nr:DUF2207 domain-containing protein [Candidatus Saccharibacteria bacterium]